MSKRLKVKIALLVLVVAASMAVVGVRLGSMQTELSLENVTQEMQQEASELPSLLEEAESNASQDTETFDAIYQSKAESVAFMANNNTGYAATDAKMLEYANLLDVDNVMVVSRAGDVLAASAETKADFHNSRFNELRTSLDSGEPSNAVEVEVTGMDWLDRYYAAAIDANTMVVIEQSPSELRELTEESDSLSSVLSNISIGQHGYVFAVSSQDYLIQYHPQDALNGADAIDSGVDAAQLEDGNYTWMTIGGEELYCSVTLIDGTYYIAAVPKTDFTGPRNLTVAVILFVFFMVMAIVVAFGIFVMSEQERRRAKMSAEEAAASEAAEYRKVGSWRFCRKVARKAAVFSFIGFLAILLISFYMQTLFALSSETVSNDERVSEIEQTVQLSSGRAAELEEQYSERYLNKARVAAYILDANPSLKTREDLGNLADVLQVQYLFTFDEEGVMTATNSSYAHFTLSETEGDQSYPFRSLLQGADSYVQEAMPDEISGDLRQYIGVPLHDAQGEASGLVQLGIRPTRLENLLASVQIDQVLDGVKVGADGFAFAVSKEDGSLAYYPDDTVQGKAATDVGMTEDQLKSGYCGYLTINGVEYYASSGETDDYLIFVAGTEGELMAERVSLTLAACAAAAVCIVIVFLVLTLEPGRTASVKKREGDKGDDDERMFDATLPSGRTLRTEAASSRWFSRSLKWGEKTPEQKTVTVAKVLLGVLVVAICVGVVFRDRIFADNSVFAYILSNKWERGFNIFAITASIMFICVAATAVAIVQWLLKIASSTMGARGETVCRMLSSFIKYATIIGMVYYSLLLIGIDGTTLLASAGLLSLAISLGAKDLLSDILSGLFIIFEGEFRVGDIIEVGGWTGTVLEIGVRTTKIDDGSGNIKVIRNSDVSNVVNRTKKLSYASCDVGMEYSESLERVEHILSEELPKIRQELPAIVDGPFYKGVVALEDSSVVIRVVVQCKETDRAQLERDLNREIKLLFDEHDISMPFPQVVINRPSIRKEATEAEKQSADEFNEEQKVAARSIGNEDYDDDRHA